MKDEYLTWTQDPTPENLATAVRAFEPTINSEIQRYSGSKPLLRSKAKVLTVKALKTYDPAKGTQLRSWVITQLQPLSRYGQGFRPVKQSELAIRQAAELNTIRGKLTDTLNREPTITELADESGLSPKRIKLLQERVKPTVSEQAFMSPETGTMQLPGIEDKSSISFAMDAVYESLSDRDRAIFDWKIGAHGKDRVANQEIAKRLGLTPAFISQRSQFIVNKILEVQQRV